MSSAITASDARTRLFPLIQQVNDDQDAVEIIAKAGSAVLISKDYYDSLVETAFLLSDPANAARLGQSLAQARAGQVRKLELR
jgi:antitoxin YefM